MDEFIDADYETLKQKRKLAVYAALVRACEDRGVTAPSYKSFAAGKREWQIAAVEHPLDLLVQLE